MSSKKSVLHATIEDKLLRRFRSLVALKLGGKKGDLSIALEEAIKFWIEQTEKVLKK